MASRLAPWVALLLLGCACAGPATPGEAVGDLAGEWQGTRLGPRGRALARLVIKPDGTYAGTLFFEGADRPFRGAIMAPRGGGLRYADTEGQGAVALRRSDGARVLTFVADGGGARAEFREVASPAR
jgi:hypothetical protein